MDAAKYPQHLHPTLDYLRLHCFIQFSWFEKFKFNYQTIVTCETSVFWLGDTCRDRCIAARLQMSKSSAGLTPLLKIISELTTSQTQHDAHKEQFIYSRYFWTGRTLLFIP